MPKEHLHFELWIHLKTPESYWHATLKNDRHEQLEFASPLELARYLASLNSSIKTQKGLR
jgi:hypothetical protein